MAGGSANGEQSPWVRSFSTRGTPPMILADDAWHYAEGDITNGPGAIGQWALRGFHGLALQTGVPVCVINGAVSGTAISLHYPDPVNRSDPFTGLWGRSYNRLMRAGLLDAVRAVLWYQGEAEGTPERVAAYHDEFAKRVVWWHEDFANLEQIYVFQLRQNSVNPLAEIQRKFAYQFDDLTVISTNGLDGHDGLHYAYELGYREMGDRVALLLERDFYGFDLADVEAIDVTGATIAGDVIAAQLDSDATTITLDDGVRPHFVVDAGRTVASVAMDGSTLLVTLNPGAGTPTTLSYFGGGKAQPWVHNANGIGLLGFTIPIAQ